MRGYMLRKQEVAVRAHTLYTEASMDPCPFHNAHVTYETSHARIPSRTGRISVLDSQPSVAC